MSKDAIFTSGYFNLDRALELLAKLDYNVVTVYDPKMLDESVNSFCTSKHEEWTLVFAEELKKEGFLLEDVNIVRDKVTSASGYILPLFSLGGRGFAHNNYFSSIVDHAFLTSISKSNAAYRFIKESNEEYKYKAALLHADAGNAWNSVIVACKEVGIPTFACFNGAITECITAHSAVKYYLNADVYYMHGQYSIDWVEERYTSDKELVVVGQPSFDVYYPINTEVVPNTFLYNSKTVFSKYGAAFEKVDCLLDRTNSAFLSHKLSSTMDKEFLQAFAVYQEEINPEAKLIVSLRPYHTASNVDYMNYVSGFGIKDCQVYGYSSAPLKKLLPTVEYVVTGASTVAIESVINRKGIVFLPGISSSYPPYKHMDEWAICSEDMSIESIVESLDLVTFLKDGLVEACDKYAPYYNYMDDGKASERLVKDMVGRL